MLKLIESKNYFERYIVIMLFFCLVDVVALFLNIRLPLGILYGPLLYLGFKSVVGGYSSYAYLHILPFLLFLFVYVFVHLGEQFSVFWISNFHQSYHEIYNLTLPISLLLYISIILLSNRKSRAEDLFIQKGMQGIRSVSVAAVILSGFLVIRIIWSENNFSSNFDLASYSFLGISIFILSYYLFFSGYQGLRGNASIGDGEKQFLEGMSVDELKMKLHECLDDTKLFLKADLTLDILAEKTNLSKHQLSYFLNRYIGKNFYQFLAEYRIAYAKKRLSEDMSITIETLAYESGFNSKTTLNKYFKVFTGFAPSQYRSGIISKQPFLR